MQNVAFKARNRRTFWVHIFSFKLYIKVFRLLETFLLSNITFNQAKCISASTLYRHKRGKNGSSYLFCEQVNVSFQFYMVLGSDHPGKVSKPSFENIFFFWGISLSQYFQFRIESISTYTKPAENDFHKTSIHISSTPKILTATWCFDLKGRVAWSCITPRGWIKQEISNNVSLPWKKNNNRGLSLCNVRWLSGQKLLKKKTVCEIYINRMAPSGTDTQKSVQS